MSKQELDLLEVPAGFPAEFGAGAAQIMRPEALDADLAGRLLNHRPNRPVTQGLADLLAAFADLPEQPAFFDPGRHHPGIDAVLDPQRHGDGTDPAPLAVEVEEHPPVLAHLQDLDVEQGELGPAEAAADQQSQDGVVALALQSVSIWDREEFTGLLPGQPGLTTPNVRNRTLTI